LFKNDRIKIRWLQSAAVFRLDGCVICDDEEAGNETKSYAILDSPKFIFYVYSILPFDITTSNARTSKKKSAKLMAVDQERKKKKSFKT